MRIAAETLEEFIESTGLFQTEISNDNHMRYVGTCRGCGAPWESNDPDILCECKDVIEFTDTKAPVS